MRIESFTITNYRAIGGPLTIDVSKRSLFPIIGINESGKTTVLQALFAFDQFNDRLNNGRHLQDTANLYSIDPGTPTVSATIEFERADLKEAFENVDTKILSEHQALFDSWRRKRDLPRRLTVTRDLKKKTYSIGEAPFKGTKVQNAVALQLIARLPYILYFDDFRDKVDQKIAIPNKDESVSGWAAIMEQLFRQTDKTLSIFALSDMEERQRKTALAKVQRHLNKTLTKEWQNFRLDDTDALEIGVEFEASATPNANGFLKLEVVERDAAGDDHFFFISDRSKGFYWFFNFVMKLECNPKVISEEQGSIYLLDEPGSYLHATAQAKLCEKLKTLSDQNTVIYCTHSHYLLNPEVIPFSQILVADKDGNGNVSLVSINEHKGDITDRRSAFQPVIDALHVKPFVLDLNHPRAILVEGIYDFYALELFKQQRPVSILPSVGADSLKFYISLMIAWQIRFRALWDNDKKGRAALENATELFGDDISDKAFRTLPASKEGGRQIMQDMFEGADLTMLRSELGLAEDGSFEKTIASVYYSPRKAELVNAIGTKTRQRFAALWESLTKDM